jgi:hypothetical protein
MGKQGRRTEPARPQKGLCAMPWGRPSLTQKRAPAIPLPEATVTIIAKIEEQRRIDFDLARAIRDPSGGQEVSGRLKEIWGNRPSSALVGIMPRESSATSPVDLEISSVVRTLSVSIAWGVKRCRGSSPRKEEG